MDNDLPHYPVVTLMVRYGSAGTAVLSVLTLLGSLFLYQQSGNWLWAVGGIIGAGLVYLILKSYVELVCIISDMLLPK